MRKKFVNLSGSKRDNISKRSNGDGIKKRYLRSRPYCKVTFKLPENAANKAQKVSIVGDFNNWDYYSTPMKKLKNGDFSVSLDLEKDREYRFRYLIDNVKWENDCKADKYIPNPFGDEDSVVMV